MAVAVSVSTLYFFVDPIRSDTMTPAASSASKAPAVPSSNAASAAAAATAAAATGTGGDRYEVLAASAPHKRKQGPKHHSRSYPRGVGLDFRKLAGLTLASYIDHHGT